MFQKLTQKRIELQSSCSDSTRKRYRDQLNMPSPYIRKEEKMSSKDDSLTVKANSESNDRLANAGICENNLFSGEGSIYKAFINDQMTDILETIENPKIEYPKTQSNKELTVNKDS